MCIRREAVWYLQGVEPSLQHGAAGLGDLTRASLVCVASSSADKIRQAASSKQSGPVHAPQAHLMWTELLSNTSCCMCRMLLPVQLIVHPAGVGERDLAEFTPESSLLGINLWV